MPTSPLQSNLPDDGEASGDQVGFPASTLSNSAQCQIVTEPGSQILYKAVELESTIKQFTAEIETQKKKEKSVLSSCAKTHPRLWRLHKHTKLDNLSSPLSPSYLKNTDQGKCVATIREKANGKGKMAKLSHKRGKAKVSPLKLCSIGHKVQSKGGNIYIYCPNLNLSSPPAHWPVNTD